MFAEKEFVEHVDQVGTVDTVFRRKPHHARLGEARAHLDIGTKNVLVAQILNQLKGLVQAPCVTQELHHDAVRVVGGSNARRSHLVEKS